jgi:hypothetical protein
MNSSTKSKSNKITENNIKIREIWQKIDILSFEMLFAKSRKVKVIFCKSKSNRRKAKASPKVR